MEIRPSVIMVSEQSSIGRLPKESKRGAAMITVSVFRVPNSTMYPNRAEREEMPLASSKNAM